MISEKEFAAIVGNTKSIVLSAISKTLPERFHYLVDDVVQETYIRAYKALVKNKFKGESALSTWLYSIARNEALRILKKYTNEEKKYDKVKQKVIEMEAVADKHELLSQSEAYKSLISQLPQLQKDVVKLYLQGFSEKEIALKLSIAGGTVKSRLSRARESLARMQNSEEYNE